MSEFVRATPLSIDQQNILNIDNNMNAQAITQEQLSTGYLINQPSDNPGLIGPVLSTNALVARTSQYVNNADDGVSFLGQANSVMNQVEGLLDQAKQLVVEIGGPVTQMGQRTPPDQIAQQLQGIHDNLLSLMNSSYLNIPIFGGTTGGQAAYDASDNYIGTGVALSRTVAPGLSLQATVVGSSVFGSGPTGALGVLTTLVADIRAGNYGQVLGADQTALETAFANVQTQGTTVGALYQAMSTAKASALQTQTVLKNQVSNVADVNLAQATTDLQQEQTTYQAALWATAQVNKYSLIQFVA